MKETTLNIEEVSFYVADYYKHKKEEDILMIPLCYILYVIQNVHYKNFESLLFEAEAESWQRGIVFRKVFDLFDEENFLHKKKSNFKASERQKDFICQGVDFFLDKSFTWFSIKTLQDSLFIKSRINSKMFSYSGEKITNESIINRIKNGKKHK